MTSQPVVWANCLVKNEERWIWYALNSVLVWVDRVLVWDTGSTDQTAAIIKTIDSPKISFKQRGSVAKDQFSQVRNEMLKQTKSDWVLILDGDEIWPRSSLERLITAAGRAGQGVRSFCVRPINFVGDIRFIHPEAFRGQAVYAPKGVKGFFSDRLFRRDIPGLEVKGGYGQEGFYDQSGLTLRENRKLVKYLPRVYYWHMSYLPRSSQDSRVMMRRRKRKYELGLIRPAWVKVPEVFYLPRPKMVDSPFYYMSAGEYFKAVVQTPLKRLKRRLTGWKRGQ